jgi:hypothetical protein
MSDMDAERENDVWRYGASGSDEREHIYICGMNNRLTKADHIMHGINQHFKSIEECALRMKPLCGCVALFEPQIHPASTWISDGYSSIDQ